MPQQPECPPTTRRWLPILREGTSRAGPAAITQATALTKKMGRRQPPDTTSATATPKLKMIVMVATRWAGCSRLRLMRLHMGGGNSGAGSVRAAATKPIAGSPSRRRGRYATELRLLQPRRTLRRRTAPRLNREVRRAKERGACGVARGRGASRSWGGTVTAATVESTEEEEDCWRITTAREVGRTTGASIAWVRLQWEDPHVLATATAKE
mmetsp:Transcript_45559/g.138456  ORF Transcript_45559/g.138456 Transcript_45559/m.138456 type:complete len:211 (+) Transcript_45559:147-779(+)